MGRAGAPLYAEDFANALETAKRLIAKIESNKYDEADLDELASVNAEIIEYAHKYQK